MLSQSRKQGSGSGVGYLWSNAATLATIKILISGIYTVTVTDANGCKSTTNKPVTVNPLPETTFTCPVTGCQDHPDASAYQMLDYPKPPLRGPVRSFHAPV